jgi:hypothetical protein
MSEPVPVQPVTIDYAGQPAALGPPIPHPGLELPSERAAELRFILQVVRGFASAMLFVCCIALLSEVVLFRYGARILAPLGPAIALVVTILIAQPLSRGRARGLAMGLVTGGCTGFGLYGAITIASGYLDLIF